MDLEIMIIIGIESLLEIWRLLLSPSQNLFSELNTAFESPIFRSNEFDCQAYIYPTGHTLFASLIIR